LSGKKIIIKSGQFVCSRSTLSLKTGIKESKVQRVLKLFENEQQIEQQTNSKYRIITILNWQKYQSGEQQIEQHTNSRRTADEQQMNTNKNEKNEKNEKKEENIKEKDDDVPTLFDDLYEKQQNQNGISLQKKKRGLLLKEYRLMLDQLRTFSFAKTLKPIYTKKVGMTRSCLTNAKQMTNTLNN